MERIDDIGAVVEGIDEDDEDGEVTLTNLQVIAVPVLDRYKSCLLCKARVEPSNPPLRECLKCSTMQRYDLCADHFSARLMVRSETKIVTVNAFGKTVEDLCDGDSVSRSALLSVAVIKELTINCNKVVVGLKK